jgi:hypothetical protein
MVDHRLGQPVGAHSTRNICRAPHLPEDRQRLWLYYKLWPNMAFDIYPDQVDFMQWLPCRRPSCVLREMALRCPMIAAR